MTLLFDCIIVGLGGMGSAAAYHLARQGKRVLGLDRFTPAHRYGSSHGHSRVIRQTHFEDPAYLPLLVRAYELWAQIEAETGHPLVDITGGLIIGAPDSPAVAGSIRSAQTYNLPHEILTAEDVQKRFPQFSPAPTDIALYEQRAGVVFPEATIQAHLSQATRAGARLQFEEPVQTWAASPAGDRVQVTTTRRFYEAERLIITAGPWTSDILHHLDLPLRVERQVSYWFEPQGSSMLFRPDRFPVFLWDDTAGMPFYGFPSQEEGPAGVKVAFARSPQTDLCTPDTIDRTVSEAEIQRMREVLAGRIPALNSRCLHTETCMSTSTPDQHFILNLHPSYPQVAIAAGFSEHGYKFASVIGEILAEIAIDGTSRHTIDLFNLARLGNGS
jgi:sarcosine oxidase